MYFENKSQENYGDVLSKYIVEKVSRKQVDFYNLPKKKKSIWGTSKYLMAIGSILNYATRNASVWGSGIISKQDTFGEAKFYAVRGPKTRERILELGFDCPEVYGDPALLLPQFYNLQVDKTYDLGIIPHYVDYELVSNWYEDDPRIKVINLLNNSIEAVTKEILSCKMTLSSSLHGLIVSHAYKIPSLWVRFSDKLSGDNIKFEDYFLSVGLEAYTGKMLINKEDVNVFVKELKEQKSSPNPNILNRIQTELLNAFPSNFKNKP